MAFLQQVSVRTRVYMGAERFVEELRERWQARRKAGLESVGITTWFDIDRLEVGDDYDRKIQRNIARCSSLIPVVSATTHRRLEGYLRCEWSYAMDRVRNMADGALFILPVSIDATNAADALVPAKFKALHFSQLTAGQLPPEVAERLKDFMRGLAQ